MDNEKIKRLEEIVEIQCTNGNWDFNSYHFGLANGLILALAIIRDEEPQFLDMPLHWREDNQDDTKIEPIEYIPGGGNVDSQRNT